MTYFVISLIVGGVVGVFLADAANQHAIHQDECRCPDYCAHCHSRSYP